MPRGAKSVLLIAGLSSLPSVSQRRDVWAEQKEEVNVVVGRPGVDKRRKWEKVSHHRNKRNGDPNGHKQERKKKLRERKRNAPF